MQKIAFLMAAGLLVSPLGAWAGTANPSDNQSTQASAEDKQGTNRSSSSAEPTDTDRAVDRYLLAQQVAAYGRESGSATALLVAGEMVRGIETTDAAYEKSTEAAASGEDTSESVADNEGQTSDAPPEPSADALFAEARQMAGADKALTSRIDRAAKQSQRGRVGGPATKMDRVQARTADVYNIPYRGGETAIFAAVGDGDTDLDLFVYDQNGNEICRDIDYSDRVICRWRPAWTGNFKIKIVNLGRVRNTYRLATN